MNDKQYKLREKRFFIIAASVCACLIITLAWFFQYSTTPPIVTPTGAPANFYLDGQCYVYNGILSYELPEGYAYYGRIHNVGSIFTGKDMEGNVDGAVYLNDERPKTAYFQWDEWDDTVSGPEPFLFFQVRD